MSCQLPEQTALCFFVTLSSLGKTLMVLLVALLLLAIFGSLLMGWLSDYFFDTSVLDDYHEQKAALAESSYGS